MKKITTEEYYERKRHLDEEQRQLDKEHMKKQFALNEKYVKLENDFDGRE